MATYVNCGFIVHAMLVFAPIEREQRAHLLRRAVEALETFEGASFVGEDPISKAFMSGGEPGVDMAVMLRHPYLDPRSDGHNGWIKLTVADDGPKRPGYLFVNINVGRDEEQVDLQWLVGVEIVPRLAAALRPSVGFMNGKLIDDEQYRALPAPAVFPRTHLPVAITPWTYMSGERLDEPGAREAIGSLPVARRSALAGGLELLVVEHLRDAPPAGFLEALARLDMRYIPPQVGAPSEDDDDG